MYHFDPPFLTSINPFSNQYTHYSIQSNPVPIDVPLANLAHDLSWAILLPAEDQLTRADVLGIIDTHSNTI